MLLGPLACCLPCKKTTTGSRGEKIRGERTRGCCAKKIGGEAGGERGGNKGGDLEVASLHSPRWSAERGKAKSNSGVEELGGGLGGVRDPRPLPKTWRGGKGGEEKEESIIYGC